MILDWQNIVQAETATKGYNGHDIVQVEEKLCGKHFTSMNWCIRAWLCKVVKPNAAEQHRQYMMSQIVWPATKVGIQAFIERVIEMNTYTKFLPSRKDEESSPSELV